MTSEFMRITAKRRLEMLKRDPRLKGREAPFSLGEFRHWLAQWAEGCCIWKCSYCSVRMPISDVRIDHRHPLALGGETALGNFAVSCARCNNIKGKLGAGEYHLLKDTVNTFHPAMAEDVWARLNGSARHIYRKKGVRSAAERILDDARARGRTG